jgi:Mn-containing catalase
MTREITHMKAFTLALETLHKPRFVIGQIPPTPGLVDQFFNDSTGSGEDGEVDARGPWNEGGDWKFVEAPAFQGMRPTEAGDESGVDDHSTHTAGETQLIEELLVENLRDILHAEGQLLKAPPKMAKAARAEALTFALETHLVQTQAQVERLKEIFEVLGVAAKGKPCKGMAGLIAEGEEMMEEGEDKDRTAADLAIIASAQKVEHYEISAYTTARTLAGQAGMPGVSELLNKSLAEEEVSDTILSQIARELMSEARTGMNKAPKRTKVTSR